MIKSSSDIVKIKYLMNIVEHREQMIKAYVKTGIFDDEDVRIIDSITNGDPYTKLIADTYKYFVRKGNDKYPQTPTKISKNEYEALEEMHEELITYNKNVFPIHDLFALEKDAFALEKWSDLRNRKLAIQRMRQIPDLYLRNLRGDIRKERQHYDFDHLLTSLRTISTNLKLVKNLKPKQQDKIYRKVFSNEFDTFEKVAKRLEDINIPYLNDESYVDDLMDKIDVLDGDAEMIYNQNDIVVILIKSFEAMSYIGCSAQWCFVTDQSQWNNYSPDGYAYIVFNFNKRGSNKKRMVTVLSNGEVYNMYNDYMENGYDYLNKIGVLDVINTERDIENNNDVRYNYDYVDDDDEDEEPKEKPWDGQLSLFEHKTFSLKRAFFTINQNKSIYKNGTKLTDNKNE